MVVAETIGVGAAGVVTGHTTIAAEASAEAEAAPPLPRGGAPTKATEMETAMSRRAAVKTGLTLDEAAPPPALLHPTRETPTPLLAPGPGRLATLLGGRGEGTVAPAPRLATDRATEIPGRETDRTLMAETTGHAGTRVGGTHLLPIAPAPRMRAGPCRLPRNDGDTPTPPAVQDHHVERRGGRLGLALLPTRGLPVVARTSGRSASSSAAAARPTVAGG